MATSDIAGLDLRNSTFGTFGRYNLDTIEHSGAITAADKVRFWKVPAGTIVHEVEIVSQVANAAATVDIGYGGPDITNDEDYFLDGANVASVGVVSSLSSGVFPKRFDTAAFLILTATTAFVAASKSALRIHYTFEGTK